MVSLIFAERYHDISCGHRVHGHESVCQHLHGHNYRITFRISGPQLDALGRVLDFSVIKSRLCIWLEENWDHRMLLSQDDPLAIAVRALDSTTVIVPFNPTAENLAKYLLEVVGPVVLSGTDTTLVAVKVEETRKCSAVATLQ